ncbi:ribokinase [Pseudonocardia sp. GCM10023141]|uniref:ribokinase n=1 Tax=Pseudonocardia sp. GCM10023141 TaxID=3252653 RepID=UPI003619DC8D
MPSAPPAPTVAVLGSVNRDSVIRVARLPQAGETVVADGLALGLGGKGANQAVAAARTGTATCFLGAVGTDAAGDELVAALETNDVDAAGVAHRDDAPSGSAFVAVSDSGENQIIVVGGANRSLDGDYVAAVADRITGASVLVMQCEVPVAALRAAAELAERAGIRIVLNLAPYVDAPDLARLADPLVVNEVEVSELLGHTVTDVATALAAADRVRGLCRSAIITLGAAGAVFISPTEARHVQGPVPREVRDTTGAGDATVGVVAAALAHGLGLGLADATRSGVEAGTRSVEHEGAADRYPRFRIRPAEATG